MRRRAVDGRDAAQTTRLVVGDCLQHALVCQGRLHAALDAVMKPWDIAALVPCVREAGGVATGLDGRDEGVVFAGSLLTSCDRGLHQQLLATLRC